LLFEEALMALREVHSDPGRELKLPRRSMRLGYSIASALYVPAVTRPCPDEPVKPRKSPGLKRLKINSSSTLAELFAAHRQEKLSP
jgi:hypothetical protein